MYHWLAGKVRRLRRNHAVEHATLHVLSEQPGAPNVVGRSDGGGFWLYGPVATENVVRAVRGGLEALQAHREDLAIHPRCGTGLAVAMVTTGALAELAGHLPMRRGWGRALVILGAAGLGLWFSQPLGGWAQRRLTTDANVSEARIRSVERQGSTWPTGGAHRPPLVIHRVLLTHKDG